MNIQPVSGYKCCSSSNCVHRTGNTPPPAQTKPPIEVKNMDKFERSEKIKPEVKNKIKNRRIGVMFSSGGGTN